MTERKATSVALTAERIEQLWAEHIKGEFEAKDADATLDTMVEDAYVNHMPVLTGGTGRVELRKFYSKHFITLHFPDASRHRDDPHLTDHRQRSVGR